ncbi:MAG: hypothetical protein NTW65_05970 [Deltaproteobacteria bacterium]|nr:hypothetical protein [Deltaproteobacteria bacterium]
MDDYKKTEESSSIDWRRSRLLESGLFLLIILIEAGIFFYLIQGKWIVGGHDGFQYLTLQYYFLNNVVNYGEIPQWMPFMTHGTVATWWYMIQNGIFQNVFLLSGSLFKSFNFLPLFYAGIFLDELLLLAGTWLLARRFFASPLTVFFVTLSIMGSCIWMIQPWFNFHFYYAIPLILYFVHIFLDSGKWRYYLLAGNLLFIQSLGNLTYYLPVISLVIFLYFFFYFIFNYQDTWQKIKSLKFGWSYIFTTTLIILSFVVLYIAANIGTDQIVNYNMRNLDGTTSLDGFLTYGGKQSWKTCLELIFGISPLLDYTLYIGILCVPFILLGLIFNLNKKNVHFALIIVILWLFSMGTFVSVFFYYCWPMMKYYRHLILLSPIIKIFLCFLAGFGFDAVFFNKSPIKNLLFMKVSLAVISILILGVSLLLWYLSHIYQLGVILLVSVSALENLNPFTILFDEKIMTSMLNRATLFALAVSILFAIAFFINRKKYFATLIILFLCFHCVDIYGFKLSEIKYKATPLNEEMYKIMDFQSMPYPKRRDISFSNNNPRAKIFSILPLQLSSFTWTTNAFLFKDELGNALRTEHWLLPLDNYMRAYWGQAIHDLSIRPRGLVYYTNMDFPTEHPATLKISGVTEDKIQFFSQADFVSSDDIIVKNITNPNYKGDIIFLSPLEKNKNVISVDSSDSSNNYLSSNKRLHLPYQVQRFDSNNLEFTTNVNDTESVWLLYSDVWHPFWRATVNGEETPVYKANLAYKAIKLEKGFNKVHFYLKSELMSLFHFIFGLNSLLWVIIIIGLAGKIVVNRFNDLTNYQKHY